MGRPNHHYVPEMLSKRFVGPDGLWFFDTVRPSREVHTRKPRTIFYKKDYNTVFNVDGTKHEAAEQFLATVENATSVLLDRIIESVRRKQVPRLSSVERSTLTIFCFLMWKRPPETRAWFTAGAASPQSFEEYAAEFEQEFKRPLDEAERQLIASPEVRERLIHNALVEGVMNLETKALPAIYDCGLHYGRAANGRSFVIGSRPVLRLGQELGSLTASIVMPIAHDVIVQFGHVSFESQGRDVEDAAVRRVNQAIWQQSSAIAGFSRDQIASLAKVPLRLARKENTRKKVERERLVNKRR